MHACYDCVCSFWLAGSLWLLALSTYTVCTPCTMVHSLCGIPAYPRHKKEHGRTHGGGHTRQQDSMSYVIVWITQLGDSISPMSVNIFKLWNMQSCSYNIFHILKKRIHTCSYSRIGVARVALHAMRMTAGRYISYYILPSTLLSFLLTCFSLLF